jgi:hypothetical protein
LPPSQTSGFSLSELPLADFLAGYTYKMVYQEMSSDGELNQVYLIELV